MLDFAAKGTGWVGTGGVVATLLTTGGASLILYFPTTMPAQRSEESKSGRNKLTELNRAR